MSLIKVIKARFSDRQKKILTDTMCYIRAIGYSDSLTKLAQIYNTDKWGAHFYTPHYSTHFSKLRKKKIVLLEIGVGGYKSPTLGGESLRMWKRYFPNGRINSIDIYDKSFHKEKRINIFRGDQTDETFLGNVIDEISSPDIIIDDGSHQNDHVIKTFNILFPFLKIGGIYVVEDVQTSYWKGFGGDSENLMNPSTIMNYFKKLTDCLNYKEFIKPGYMPTYFDKHIVSVHFYHNLIFIYKGNNIEESNLVLNNEWR
jgi:hypothetical protein